MSASRQPTPQTLRDDLLAFLQRKFYDGRPVVFAKDRRRLLEWVVLWPARWLDQRGVTLPPDRYKAVFLNVFLDSLRFGDTGNITYLPAWLAKVIQSHFQHHGDELYQEAKSIRTLADSALFAATRIPAGRAPDPVRELAQAARLLKPSKRPLKPTPKSQLTLL